MTADPSTEVLLLRLDPDLPAPAYAHPGDAGADLVTRIDVVIPPQGRVTVPDRASPSRCPTGSPRSCTRGPAWPCGTG